MDSTEPSVRRSQEERNRQKRHFASFGPASAGVLFPESFIGALDDRCGMKTSSCIVSLSLGGGRRGIAWAWQRRTWIAVMLQLWRHRRAFWRNSAENGR